LANPALPAVLTEGEFKTISLYRLASHQCSAPRFLPIGLSGVWNWRGTIGKFTDEFGHRIDQKGTIPDFSRIVFDDRRVLIIFDRDLETNESVYYARTHLTKELEGRGAIVSWFSWPVDEAPNAKGVDDLLAAIGPEKVFGLIEKSFASPASLGLVSFGFNDAGNSERLILRFGANLRYCNPMNGWLVWDGSGWDPDEIQKGRHLSRLTVVAFLKEALDVREK
jgi:hypothetical protein